MVLPLIDENKPKCYYCYEMFDNIEKLREHQKEKHIEKQKSQENQIRREPAPGDVTVF
jgi:quinol monooxygenase YgiN